MPATIRRAAAGDADFIARTMLMSQRGHRPRGWFDIALDRPEPECMAFVRAFAVVSTRSVWHVSRFWIAEADGVAAAALCALRAGDISATTWPAIQQGMHSVGLMPANR